MTVGTKSILFGAHAFWLHPFFVAAAWWKLYGFSSDIRLLAACVLHDIGYWGSSSMDGIDGKKHPEVGARWMEKLFGKEWGDFCLFHSRSYARQHRKPVSKLCYADKMATALTPWWIYLPLVNLTGEIDEYMANGKQARFNSRIPAQTRILLASDDQRQWYEGLQRHMREWVEEHMSPSQEDGLAKAA